ncbi:MAG: triose-phosphate isomerase [Oscillospiraceae bacterium]|nr:triose-phosphate isomerase [Oscillospiraceae bacterium]
MKRIYVNFKRFDVPAELGGVNRLAPIQNWGAHIVDAVSEPLAAYSSDLAAFTMFFPEAHILSALGVVGADSPLAIGCQGVYREDIAPDGNFGAFTTNRPAAAAKALGCETVIIGHCEERRDFMGILAAAGCDNSSVVNELLNQGVLCATKQGLSVLYCIGETAEQKENWQAILREQLELGLKNAPRDQIVIAYEPVWAIGPGKTPPDRDTIQEIAQFIKGETDGLPLVYGGGLKADNAEMLASIPEIDGGLIALTRFTGEIGFYPEEFLEIVRLYLGQ